MDKWIILSNLPDSDFGEFDTEEDCETKCRELRELYHLVNVYFIPFNKSAKESLDTFIEENGSTSEFGYKLNDLD